MNPFNSKAEMSYSTEIIKDTEGNPVAIQFPVEKRYSLDYKVDWSRQKGNTHIADIIETSNSFSRRHKFVSENEAVNNFLLDSDNEPLIRALFFDSKMIQFFMIEEYCAELYRDAPLLTISAMKIEYNEELLKNSAVIEAYEEIQRAQEAKNKALKEEEDAKIREKNRIFFEQWEFLEKKRAKGDFDYFLQKVDAKA